MNFGLTRQEATIYLMLFGEGELSGYEVSKRTGISRSNTYTALAGLVEKGAAYVIEGSAVLYTPVDIEEFCDNKIRFLNKSKMEIKKAIPKKREESDSYITIKSKRHIVDKMKKILLEAEERVYISMSIIIVEELFEEIRELLDRGIKVVIITDDNLSIQGAKTYFTSKNKNQIRVIVDSRKVLTGDIKDKENSTCLYSTNDNLVQVFKEALANEIKLIEIGEGSV